MENNNGKNEWLYKAIKMKNRRMKKKKQLSAQQFG